MTDCTAPVSTQDTDAAQALLTDAGYPLTGKQQPELRLLYNSSRTDRAVMAELIRTQADAVCELFGGKKEDIKVIGIRHGEKMYETLLTNEECAKAEDMGNFYRVPADNRTLNYDKFFTEGDDKRVTLSEFNSDNTQRLTVEETKAKIAGLEYIQNELKGLANIAK